MAYMRIIARLLSGIGFYLLGIGAPRILGQKHAYLFIPGVTHTSLDRFLVWAPTVFWMYSCFKGSETVVGYQIVGVHWAPVDHGFEVWATRWGPYLFLPCLCNG